MKSEKFLDQLYRKLYLSEEVLHNATEPSNKFKNIHNYMQRLEKTHSETLSEHQKELLKKLYHQKYVIKENNIPENYNKDDTIKKQEESLDKWLDYFLDGNTRYPMWCKFWAFQGMLKIGNYDEASNTYTKRTKTTLSPFIEPNAEIISKCIETIRNFVDKEELPEDEVRTLVEAGNFVKIYQSYSYKQKLKILSSNTAGIWKKYSYETREIAEEKEKNGIEPEYLKLYNSLQGYNTGWCTAGSKITAKDQVCGTSSNSGYYYEGGDFYVYYTEDENGEYKIPRIAIRMNETEYIGEIRGVADSSQNLEECMEEILKAKLETMENADQKSVAKYLKIMNNSRTLTRLNNKKNEDYTLEDQKFIHQKHIDGFAVNEDPRCDKLRKK